MTTPAEHPVVVVGAGMAGLVAARELRRRDIEVLVVEAANRPGGRAMSETTQLGSRVDLGGQWIGHDHGRLRALADELGVAYYQMHTRALPVLVDGPRRIRMTSVAPALVAFAGAELVSRMRPRARWSDVTVEAWLRRVPGSRVRRLLEVVAWVSWTADLDRFSVRSMAEMIRLQGGLATALTTRGGAQDSLLVDGVGALIDAMAAELGARLRLGERVTSIAQQPDGVTVTTASGSVTAAKVIVTTAPPIAARIDYQPPLPPVLADLQRRSYMGSVYKAIAVYDYPFWRGRGSGELIVLDNPGRSVFDTSPPGGPGHLCVLVAGPEARALDALSENDRRHAVLGTVALHLGSEILSPRSWHEKAWHRDEYAEGGYMAIPEPGSAARLPMPSSPSGNIHWAGTETASEHPGYLEGAIESGVRASGEVIAALGA